MRVHSTPSITVDTNRRPRAALCRLSFWIVVLAGAGMFPATTLAQGLENRTRIVLRGGYDTEREAGGAGLAIRIPLSNAVEIIPSGDYFFVDVGDAWQGNLDASIRFGKRGMFYLGTGLAVINRRTATWHTDVGLNLFGGLAVETPGGRFGLIVEPRFTLRDTDGGNPFYVALGVSIALGP